MAQEVDVHFCWHHITGMSFMSNAVCIVLKLYISFLRLHPKHSTDSHSKHKVLLFGDLLSIDLILSLNQYCDFMWSQSISTLESTPNPVIIFCVRFLFIWPCALYQWPSTMWWIDSAPFDLLYLAFWRWTYWWSKDDGAQRVELILESIGGYFLIYWFSAAHIRIIVGSVQSPHSVHSSHSVVQRLVTITRCVWCFIISYFKPYHRLFLKTDHGMRSAHWLRVMKVLFIITKCAQHVLSLLLSEWHTFLFPFFVVSNHSRFLFIFSFSAKSASRYLWLAPSGIYVIWRTDWKCKYQQRLIWPCIFLFVLNILFCSHAS